MSKPINKKINFPVESVKNLPVENNEQIINNISNNDIIISQVEKIEDMPKVEELVKEQKILTDTDRKACILVKKI